MDCHITGPGVMVAGALTVLAISICIGSSIAHVCSRTGIATRIDGSGLADATRPSQPQYANRAREQCRDVKSFAGDGSPPLRASSIVRRSL